MIVPAGAAAGARRLIVGRGIRAFVDGFIAVLLPAYLLALGYSQWQVGVLGTATLLGSALLTLALGTWGHRWPPNRLLLGAALLMTLTGLAFASFSAFWPLLIVAFVGTINPGSGDVSVFVPLEQTRLADSAGGDLRTTVFARYSLIAALCAAFGALAAATPAALVAAGMALLPALRLMFVAYAGAGVAVWLLYRGLPAPAAAHRAAPPAPLAASRTIVWRLAALFSLDSFAGGLVVNSLLALWLFERFGLSLAGAGTFFFWAGLLSALSQLLAPVLARRVGLINTMVFTHMPANVCLILAALASDMTTSLALLLARSALSQMDVPARTAFVMAVVTPPERVAAASFTAVPRSLAAAFAPALGGALIATGWLAAPLLACGALKLVYDLSLFAAFRRVRPHA